MFQNSGFNVKTNKLGKQAETILHLNSIETLIEQRGFQTIVQNNKRREKDVIFLIFITFTVYLNFYTYLSQTY